jgi:myo-inositol-1(or 4)-monophosphatase
VSEPRPTLYALNVGRGDAFFLEIPKGDSKAIVLMDGGDLPADEPASPFLFMQDQGWAKLDLLILTHLHPDHVVGLLPVAEHMQIAEAVLPYPYFEVQSEPMVHPKAKQSKELFDLYGQLYRLLEKQNTHIRLRPPFGEQAVWHFGQTALRHLDPMEKEHLVAYKAVERLCGPNGLSFQEQERLFMEFDALSNGDSSAWLVEHGESRQQLMLLGGDALLPNWRRFMERETLRPNSIKVSHHGMRDALDESLLQRLNPQWFMITNHCEEFQVFRDFWQSLEQASGSKLYVTGEQIHTRYLVSELPDLPQIVSNKLTNNLNPVEFAKQIAKEAGTMIKSQLGTSYEMNEKSSSFDLVTEIDRAAEQMIRQRILDEFPGHSFLGEEESFGDTERFTERLDQASKEPYVWIVDPIDGTSNFVHNMPGFTVSIALACQGEIIAGVIYDPCMDEMYWAEKGKGAFVNGKRLAVSSADQLKETLLGTGFPTDERARAVGIECLSELSRKSRSIRSFGSAALQLAFVASGKLGAYWEYGLNVWDTAAGVLLIQEAGGAVTDTSGHPYSLFTKNIVASNGIVHQSMLECMKPM